MTPDGHRLRRVQKMSVGFAGREDKVDLGGLRTRLRKMSDQELLRFGQASKSICSPDANFGKLPRECFVMSLFAEGS